MNCDILSQIATLSKSNGLSKDDLSQDGNKCILYGELYTRYLGYIDTIISKTKTILSKPKLSKSGDIIMPLSGETPTDISNSAVVPEDNVILGGDLLVITPKKNIDSLFLSLYLSNCKKKEIAKKSCGISIIHSHKEDIAKLTINYPSLAEQYYISTFLKKLTKKTDIVLKKIDILKKYKEGIEKYAYKFVENQGSSIKFSDLFDNLIEKNNHKFQQYTIGKNGIKKIDEINYDISNHKIFKKFNVIVGIGIDEIGINKDLEYGSVSPVYDVYNIRNLKYFDSIYVTLKEQLWKKRNFITRKSTRREFEVDKYELKKMMLRVVDNKDFTNVYQSITNIKKVIEILNFSFNNLKTIKSYILRHMFI